MAEVGLSMLILKGGILKAKLDLEHKNYWFHIRLVSCLEKKTIERRHYVSIRSFWYQFIFIFI